MVNNTNQRAVHISKTFFILKMYAITLGFQEVSVCQRQQVIYTCSVNLDERDAQFVNRMCQMSASVISQLICSVVTGSIGGLRGALSSQSSSNVVQNFMMLGEVGKTTMVPFKAEIIRCLCVCTLFFVFFLTTFMLLQLRYNGVLVS